MNCKSQNVPPLLNILDHLKESLIESLISQQNVILYVRPTYLNLLFYPQVSAKNSAKLVSLIQFSNVN